MSDTPPAPGTPDPEREAKLAELWDQVRKKFATSIMVETKLSSLAQNAETVEWPLEADDETPSKYIDFSYEELKMLPELAPDPTRIELLINILHETLAFDDPFGDMAEQIETSTTEGDKTVTKVLKELKIPEDYPIQLSNLSETSQDLCSAEGIETIGQFADFAQNMAQNVVIGGDFRIFINALQQSDEEEIANFLPFRPNSKGLHLPEAFGMLIKPLSSDQKLAIRRSFDPKGTEAELEKHPGAGSIDGAALFRKLVQKLNPVLVYFSEEREALNRKIQAGENMERYFMVLNDQEVESIAIHLMNAAFEVKGAKAPVEVKKQKGGFFGRLFGGK